MAVKNEVDTAVVKACLQILPDTLRQQNFDMGIRLMKALDNGREPLCRNAGVRADDDSARRKPVDFRGKLGKPVLLMQKVADYDKNFFPVGSRAHALFIPRKQRKTEFLFQRVYQLADACRCVIHFFCRSGKAAHCNRHRKRPISCVFHTRRTPPHPFLLS